MNQCLIKQKLVSKQLSYVPNALLIGKAGSGKTTLATMLSKSNHRTNAIESKPSLEENVYSVVYDGNEFNLIDTSDIDISERLNTQVNSQESRISTIFLVIKYDTRFEKMIIAYLNLGTFITNNTDRIIVMISHWDHSKTPEEDFKEICDLFTEECPHFVNIICYSEQYVDAELAKLMYNCISNMRELELTSHVNEDDMKNSNNTSSTYCQEVENKAIRKFSNSSTNANGSSDDQHEQRIKKDLKRPFHQCQSDSDSHSTLRQENGTSNRDFDRKTQQSMYCDSFDGTNYIENENESVERNKSKKMKSESSTLPFWRRWQDYCSIS